MVDITIDKKEEGSSWYCRPIAERGVLSLCLKSMSNFIEVSSKLSTPEYFLDSGNRALYTVLLSLVSIGIEEFDLNSVASLSNDFGVLEKIGGYEYIDALFHSDVKESNLSIYTKQVLEASILYRFEKKLKKEAEYVHGVGSSPETNSGEVVSKVEESILSVSLDTLNVEDGHQVAEGLRGRLVEFESNPESIRGLCTGFGTLDRLVNGLHPGSLSILSARAKTGKSIVLMNWGTHLCTKENIPVLVIDTEMTKEEFQTRQLSHLSGVPERIIKNGLYVNDTVQREAVYYALEIMEKMPYTHKYMPGYRIEDVKSMVRKYKAKNDIGVFLFDYIKAVDLPDGLNESQVLGRVTSALKDLAGVLSIPIVAAAQLKRDSHGKSFVGSDDIGDSDKILRYCNLLMALTKKKKKEIDEDGVACGTHRLQILDNRGGSSLYSGIDLMFNAPIITFKEASRQSSDAMLEQRKLEEEINRR